ncbi:AfsR/SARP family transcriptional regulator [Jiangella alba]|uniref:DNA-binding transcriptional activator of the SARP family n=1 Tax=Jiangella alba TaxID=561176 RepID=A0A1H5PX37_9ACTN|nr:BTAD domain-containing putative transcriptional regulator [Jiangella alba]SEF18432.1 DNA-binding transcriptional activator of the SARP family [Jiangella alba]
MRFEVLGPLRVRCESGPVAVSGSLRQGVLALLLAQSGRPVPADTLVDALWGDDAGDGGSKLQLHVHKLRRLLDTPDRLSHDAGAYRLRVGAGELDAESFASMVAEAETAGPDRAADLLGDALALWRGDAYQGLDLPALAAEIQRLTELRLVAQERLAAAELARGRGSAAIAQLTDLVSAHPLRERAHALLMTALWAGGRQADALAVYRDVRQALVDELGLEPGTELRDLERRILAGEDAPDAGPAPAAPIPAQLPPAAGVFVGRDAELAELSRIEGGSGGAARIAVVTGTAGVGKTALALRWAHRAAAGFPDGQLYVDLRGYGPDQPVRTDDVLARLLRGLGVDGAAIAADVAERAAQFRTLAGGRRLLVFLDNASSAEQVRPVLPGSGSCFVVVTSRDALGGLSVREDAHRIDLDRLTSTESALLMDSLLGERPGDAVTRIVERCAGLPLALRIAAERVRERHDGDIGDLADELADEQVRLDLLEVGDDPQASVRSVFSWSYQGLDAEVARAFRLSGLHPGNDFDAYAVSAVTGENDLRSTRRRLHALVRARLVDDIGGGRYRLHDLLRVYAAELTQAEDGAAAGTAAFARLAGFYVQAAARAMAAVFPGDAAAPVTPAEPVVLPDLDDYDAAMRWLDTERLVLLSVGDHAPTRGLPGHTTDLSGVLWRYLDLGGYYEEARSLHGRALDAARTAADRHGEGWALGGLGLTAMRMRAPEAGDLLRSALAVHEARGEGRGQAMVLNYLAAVDFFDGRKDAGISHLRRAIALYDELGDEALVARPLNNLGGFYRMVRRYDDAIECLERALGVAERCGDRPSVPHILLELGALSRMTGRFDAALDYAQRGLRATREHGVARLEGIALSDLGLAHGRLGDRERAFDFHRQARQVAERDRLPELWAEILIAAGRTHRLLGEDDASVGAFEEALARFDHPSAFTTGAALQELGEVYAARGDHARALDHWGRAVVVFDRMHRPEGAELRCRIAELGGIPPGDNALEEQTSR